MTADEAEEAIRKWEKDWKRDRDKLRRNRQGDVDGCSFVDGGTIDYTGCTDDILRPMVNVSNSPLVKSYRIEGLNETNIMPIWWHTSHWRRQYPADSVVWSTVDIESLRNAAASTKSNHMEFKLCPPYSAQR